MLKGFAICLSALLFTPAMQAESGVTFHKDVEPILQRNCQGCHRPGETAPMSLLSYKDARSKVLEAFEARYLKALLDRSKGNVSAAARTARMDRSHLIELLQRHGLKD